MVIYTEAEFGPTGGAFALRVSDVFSSPSVTALSSSTGYALYLNPSQFANVNFGGLLDGTSIASLLGGLSDFGLATLLHEVLHKLDKLGFTITDGYLKDQFRALGLFSNDEEKEMGTGVNSLALRRLCW